MKLNMHRARPLAFILPTWIEGRKFEVPHCEKCGCIPYGGIGPDSRFCMKCGRRVMEVACADRKKV